jgi:peptide/nickel transport system substrate-binding protein
VWSDKNTVVTITLKHWYWSNGTPVTARDLMFWMNLASATSDPNAPFIGSSTSPGPEWAGETPGEYPLNIVSYSQTGRYSVTLKLNASYSPIWYEYNQLTEIVPMPQAAWDKLSANGPVGNYDESAQTREILTGTTPATPAQYVPQDPGTADSGALGVAQFINVQSQDLTTYATNPLWQVVDGPFKLTQFTPDGFAKLVPNKHYSGAVKPTISALEELPFTSGAAEFDALRSGALTIGYIPQEDLPQAGGLERSQGYKFSPWDAQVFDYMPYNFTNPTVGPLFKQLYFRQAIQSLVNQRQYVKSFFSGIGVAENGPVPEVPKGSPYLSPLAAHGQVYPYSPSKAVNLLKSNGWKVVPGGASYCMHPGSGSGECGTGILAGEKARISILYGSGVATIADEVEAMQSALKRVAGIDLSLSSSPANQVGAVVFDGCTFAAPCSTWDLAYFGNPSWTYTGLPTLELNFLSGSSSNPGDYSSATNDRNIFAADRAPSAAATVKAYFVAEDYLARQLPVVYVPEEPAQLTMYKKGLSGFAPQVANLWISPQTYRLAGS